MPVFQSHTEKKRRARIWLSLVLVLVSTGNALFLKVAFEPTNPYPALRGLVIGAILWSLVLIVITWRRQPWARYALITLMTATIAGFAMALLLIATNRFPVAQSLPLLTGGGIALYVCAMVPLIASRSVHHLMGPMTASGH